MEFITTLKKQNVMTYGTSLKKKKNLHEHKEKAYFPFVYNADEIKQI